MQEEAAKQVKLSGGILCASLSLEERFRFGRSGGGRVYGSQQADDKRGETMRGFAERVEGGARKSGGYLTGRAASCCKKLRAKFVSVIRATKQTNTLSSY